MTKRIYKILSTSSVLLIAIVIGLSSCKSQRGIFKSRKNRKNKNEVAVEQTSLPVMVEQAEETVIEPAPTPVNEPRNYSKEQQLNNYFNATANASTTAAANATIQEALTMFSSSEAVVLIVIYNGGGSPSYDAPTTISKYLNYLKDTKNYNTEVEEMVYDSNGKVKELILKK